MANIFPIIAGLGAAYFLMRSKDGGGAATNGSGSGFGTGAGGTTPCHLLTGIWSEPHSAASPLAAVTSNATLLALPLTLDAFTKADQFFLNYFNTTEEPEQDIAVFQAEKLLTEGLDCQWGKPSKWTPRMTQIHGALKTLFNAGTYQAP